MVSTSFVALFDILKVSKVKERKVSLWMGGRRWPQSRGLEIWSDWLVTSYNSKSKSYKKIEQIYGYGSFADNFLEDFEELGFGNFAIRVLVHGSDELVNFLLGDLPVLFHMFESMIDELGDFISL